VEHASAGDAAVAAAMALPAVDSAAGVVLLKPVLQSVAMAAPPSPSAKVIQVAPYDPDSDMGTPLPSSPSTPSGSSRRRHHSKVLVIAMRCTARSLALTCTLRVVGGVVPCDALLQRHASKSRSRVLPDRVAGEGAGHDSSAGTMSSTTLSPTALAPHLMLPKFSAVSMATPMSTGSGGGSSVQLHDPHNLVPKSRLTRPPVAVVMADGNPAPSEAVVECTSLLLAVALCADACVGVVGTLPTVTSMRLTVALSGWCVVVYSLRHRDLAALIVNPHGGVVKLSRKWVVIERSCDSCCDGRRPCAVAVCLRRPVTIRCWHCDKVGETIVSHNVGCCVYGSVCLVLVLCWPCACLPCCMDELKDVVHACPHCQQPLGSCGPCRCCRDRKGT
jgi:hypothetical protein